MLPSLNGHTRYARVSFVLPHILQDQHLLCCLVHTSSLHRPTDTELVCYSLPGGCFLSKCSGTRSSSACTSRSATTCEAKQSLNRRTDAKCVSRRSHLPEEILAGLAFMVVPACFPGRLANSVVVPPPDHPFQRLPWSLPVSTCFRSTMEQGLIQDIWRLVQGPGYRCHERGHFLGIPGAQHHFHIWALRVCHHPEHDQRRAEATGTVAVLFWQACLSSFVDVWPPWQLTAAKTPSICGNEQLFFQLLAILCLSD